MGAYCGRVFLVLFLYSLNGGKCLQDSDFVADKDDEGSPTDDSGADDSDASKSGDEKEVPDFLFSFVILVVLLYS